MSSHQLDVSAVLPVIGRIYDTALDVQVWPEVIAKIASLHACDKAYLFTTHPPAEGGVFFSVGLRGLSERSFGERERAIHNALIPHISRALGIMFRLRDSELRVASTLAGFDRLASGVVLLGKQGLPAYVLNFSALPEQNEFGSGIDRPCAIVFLTDPARPVHVDAELLGRLYGLTQAECRLGALLCSGDTLAVVATKLNVREATVKTQLQSIFDKTQTRRQVQLVKLLVSLASSDAT